MITRLPAGDLESYTKLKTFILAKHKLSSKDYKQRFSHGMRNSKETNVAYVSRLSTLQDYWLSEKSNEKNRPEPKTGKMAVIRKLITNQKRKET